MSMGETERDAAWLPLPHFSLSSRLLPVRMGNESLYVMSLGFLMQDKDAPVIWRGPKKNGEGERRERPHRTSREREQGA